MTHRRSSLIQLHTIDWSGLYTSISPRSSKRIRPRLLTLTTTTTSVPSSAVSGFSWIRRNTCLQSVLEYSVLTMKVRRCQYHPTWPAGSFLLKVTEYLENGSLASPDRSPFCGTTREEGCWTFHSWIVRLPLYHRGTIPTYVSISVRLQGYEMINVRVCSINGY